MKTSFEWHITCLISMSFDLVLMLNNQIANFIHGHSVCHLTLTSNFELENMSPLSISTLQELFKGI
jgi:hypothetical protein